MAETIFLQTDADVANIVVPEGRAVQFYVNENNSIKQKMKLHDGTISEISGNGGVGGGEIKPGIILSVDETEKTVDARAVKKQSDCWFWDGAVKTGLLYDWQAPETYPYLSTPVTLNESGWVITSSGTNTGGQGPEYAFDGDDTTKWAGSENPEVAFIAWQNTEKKVLVKTIQLTQTSEADMVPSVFQLQGSNDGTNWMNIGTEVAVTLTAGIFKCTYPDNEIGYHHHRLTNMLNSRTGSMQSKQVNIYTLEAWSEVI